MRMRKAIPVVVAGALVVWAAEGIGQAATITGFGDIVAPGAGVIAPTGTVAPNNDNSIAASPNVINASSFFNTLVPYDIEFVVAESGGTTEYFYNVIPLGYVNVNTLPWTGFRFELGFGTGADFVPVSAASPLDFDTPTRDPLPTSSVFTNLDHQPNQITWTGGTVNPLVGGQGPPFSVFFSFSFDVPDGLSSLHPGGLNRFTLRQTAITSQAPEPAATALFALAAAAAAVSRRRIKK